MSMFRFGFGDGPSSAEQSHRTWSRLKACFLRPIENFDLHAGMNVDVKIRLR
jgi:hypothetical protein